MKKVLLTGAALMLVGGMVATEASYAAEPGVNITGNARVRLWYLSEDARNTFGNKSDYDDEVSMDSRVRLDVTGTAAGGAYAKVRIRMMETLMGDGDTDGLSITHDSQSNIWVDKAYVGIPFSDTFTLEVGKYRSTYGPLGATYNFFYDDVHLTGFKGIIKLDNVTINPFVEWMEEAQNDETTASDKLADNDEMRFGVHAKAKLNSDWTIGGMLGYQADSRNGVAGSFEANEGFFASIYAKGQSGNFAIHGELAVTDNDLNGFNSWLNDGTGKTTTGPVWDATLGQYVPGVTATDSDDIGSDDTGFGGYAFPNFQIDKLNIGMNIGFTTGGFVPDRAFGFVMLGASDNSKITRYAIGYGGDWFWVGLVPSYQISESLKLTGNLVYADVSGWDYGSDEGPMGAQNGYVLDSAWELSAILQYTISKGADVYFSAGYLAPDIDASKSKVGYTEDDGAFAALTRFELKF